MARKGGPGIARADLLVINKTDLAPHVGVDVATVVADADVARDGRTVLALSRTDETSMRQLTAWGLSLVEGHRASSVSLLSLALLR